jgi:hypothetical protein
MPMQIIDPVSVGDKCMCDKCGQTFTIKASLKRHQNQNICSKPKVNKKRFIEVAEILKASNDAVLASNDRVLVTNNEILKRMSDGLITLPIQKMDTLAPIVVSNNQNLNVLCLGSKDNLLDILSNKEGLPRALEYLKDCALAKLAGDCRILERVYQLETDQPVIMYLNQSKTKYVYYDDRRRRTVETNAKVMAKKLADILQRSYLKGMTCFKTDLAGNERDDCLPIHEVHGQDKMPDLAPYDMQNWNEHVHLLSDEKYQKKVLTSMKIPIEIGRE